jgi:riboflavin kinase/FMN adenylyltransferase
MPKKIELQDLFVAKVVKGDQRGRKIGFPTANLDLQNEFKNPEQGIYSSLCKYNNELYESTTHIGPASTFGKETVTFEVFIHDFDKEIYGEELAVFLVKKTRGTLKFNSVEELVEQMKKDVLESQKNLNLKDYEF